MKDAPDQKAVKRVQRRIAKGRKALAKRRDELQVHLDHLVDEKNVLDNLIARVSRAINALRD